MIENGFYILDKSYRDLVKRLNGELDDQKSRPIFCCMKDKNIDGLYWLIPTSDLSHRTPEQIQKYKDLETVKDIRQAYYYIGHTTRPALFKISKVFPVSDKYISHEYQMQGIHLIMKDKAQIAEIQQRLQRILSYEALYPNKLEQKITAVKEYICNELQQEIDKAAQQLPLYLKSNKNVEDILNQNNDLKKMYPQAEIKYFATHPHNPRAKADDPSSPLLERYEAARALRNEYNAIVCSDHELKSFFIKERDMLLMQKENISVPPAAKPTKTFSQSLDEMLRKQYTNKSAAPKQQTKNPTKPKL